MSKGRCAAQDRKGGGSRCEAPQNNASESRHNFPSIWQPERLGNAKDEKVGNRLRPGSCKYTVSVPKRLGYMKLGLIFASVGL